MIKNQALGSRSNKGLILLGLFLGLISAVLVVVYLSQTDGGGGGDVSGAEVTPVVVASLDIAAGTRIEEGMVETKEIAIDAVLGGAFGETEVVIGQVARVPLVAGEQVIPTKVTATGAAITVGEDPPLALVVPEGMRAVAIQVSGVIAASGLIRPGDYVDVILTVQVEENSGDEGSATGSTTTRNQVARIILQNAQVLSIDQNVALTSIDEGAAGSPAVTEEDEASPEATTVTLAVSPTHGEVLTVAETCGNNFSGRLALALRGLGDASPVVTRSVWEEGGAMPNCAALLGLTSLQ